MTISTDCLFASGTEKIRIFDTKSGIDLRIERFFESGNKEEAAKYPNGGYHISMFDIGGKKKDLLSILLTPEQFKETVGMFDIMRSKYDESRKLSK